MKKQTETDEIISIDLDEEKPKQPKTKELEIKAGDLYIKIPADRSRIREAIEFLQVFERQLNPAEKVITGQKIGYPLLTKIEDELTTTKQFLEDTRQQQNKIEQKIAMPEQAQEENETLLDKHPVFTKCPKCSGKIKKKKIEVVADGFIQKIVCKNRHCKWSYTYKIVM
jgi:hypothetical protein